MSRIEQLLKQQDLNEALSQKQKEQISLKQEQLYLLEQKLAELEGLGLDQATTTKNTPDTFTQSTINTQKQTLTDPILQQLMQDPRVSSQMEQLQSQVQELQQLEQQLNDLKRLKQMMKERQDLLLTLANDVSTNTLVQDNLVIEEIDDAVAENFVDGVGTTARGEDLNDLEDDQDAEDKREDEKMKESINKMEQYLERLNQQGDPTEEQLVELMNMLDLLRSSELGAFDPEPSPLYNNSNAVKDSVDYENTKDNEEVAIKEEQEIVIKAESEDDDVEFISITDTTDTETRIQLAITQIQDQLQMVESSKDAIQTKEEQEYFDLVVGKLKQQLKELEVIQSDLKTHKAMLEEARIEKESREYEMNEARDALEARSREYEMNEENGQQEEYENEYRLSPAELKPEFDRRFGTKQDGLDQEMKRLDRAQAQLEQDAQELSNDSKTKQLFAEHRDGIVRQVEQLIDNFESRPFFLKQVLKKINLLKGNEYAQQRVLLLLEELTE